MKILHIGESIRGGCGTYLNEIVPLQMRSLGAHNVRCLVPRQHAAQLPDVPRETLLTFERPARAAGLPRLALASLAAIRQWRPDLIHAHSTFAGAVVRLLSLAWPLPPVIYCPHGWVFEVGKTPSVRAGLRLAERLLSYLSHVIVAISNAERQQGEQAGIEHGRLAVIPNGISAKSPRHRAAWNDPRLKVLFVGRLDRQKGVDVLLQAARPLGARLSLRIVGEQVLSGSLQPIVEEALGGALSHVEFLGWQDRDGVAAQINACDVVVMPSRWEGFGLVAVEAMRAAKPVVASAVGGLADIVQDGVTGRLVPPDDPQALAAALLRDTPAALRRMGEAGRARFMWQYTSDRTANGLLRTYAHVLLERAHPWFAPARGGTPGGAH